jgi:hypothetical protein
MTDEISAAATARDESRIWRASEAIRDIANDMKPTAQGLEPVVQRLTDNICQMTRQAPLQSLALAFLLGVLVARRK